MTGPAVRREDALLARTRGHRAKLARAESLLAEALAEATRPAVAWSGGKDSLVCLALAARLRPGVAAIWSDDELVEPETPAHVGDACERMGATLVPLLGWAEHAGWFRPWTDRPFWREPLPDGRAIGCRVEAWQAAAGFDLGIVGVRAAESWGRRWNWRRRGALYDAPEGGRRCTPLAGWTGADVWAAIAAFDLPYNPAYDALAAAGVPRDLWRVGPLPLCPGWVLRTTRPAVYRRLIERYGARW